MTVRHVYYVGQPSEVAHHAAPLADRLPLTTIDADDVVGVAKPGDVCLFFNEYFERFRRVIGPLRQRGCPTILVADGIFEWRNLWEAPYESWAACEWAWRPVLCDKVATIGPSQSRILESWGNLGKTEIVGIPRLDHDIAQFRDRMAQISPSDGQPGTTNPDRGRPLRLLVMTAKAVGFAPEQRDTTLRSLVDLKRYLQAHPTVDGRPIEVTWRVTQHLEKPLGIENRLGNTTGGALRDALSHCDAVITTPSTAMIEAMLADRPVALLDYHNRPDYVPAAWKISAAEHFEAVFADLAAPPASRRLYQDTILTDTLQTVESATDRLVRLIEAMAAIAERRPIDTRGNPVTDPVAENLNFPPQMLDVRREPTPPEQRFNLAELYPDHPDFADPDRTTMAAELAHLRREHARLRRLARWSLLRFSPWKGPPA